MQRNRTLISARLGSCAKRTWRPSAADFEDLQNQLHLSFSLSCFVSMAMTRPETLQAMASRFRFNPRKSRLGRS